MIDPELVREYCEYSSPSDRYNNLNKTIGSEENNVQINAIKNKLANLMEAIKRSPTSDAKKIKNRNNMLNILQRVLEFNKLNQS